MKKFILTSLMFLIATFISGILVMIKDYEMIPLLEPAMITDLKSICFFASIIFFLIYSIIACFFQPKKLFYLITIFFISFFLIYAFALRPNREMLYIDLSVFISKNPELKFLLLLISNWSVALFYIISDLWRSVILSFVLWQFANDIYTIKEAKIAYPIFGIIGLIGMKTAGIVQSNIFSGSDMNWQLELQSMIGIAVIAGSLLIAIYYCMNRFVLEEYKSLGYEEGENKENLSYMDGLKYIGLISLIVIASTMSIELVTSLWKSQLRITYSSISDYSSFMSSYTYLSNIYLIITISISAIFLFAFKYFKWLVGALVTPIIMLIIGGLFFMVTLNPEAEILSSMPLATPIIIGAIFSGLIQYTNIFFLRPFREIAYIPLNNRFKNIGKAFVDMVVARSGQILTPIMIMFLSKNNKDLSNITSESMYIFLFMITLWIIASFSLSKSFEKRIS